MTNTIVISFNRGRKIVLFFIFLFFVLACVFFYMKADVLTKIWIIKQPWVFRVSGIVGGGIAGTMFIVYLRVLFRETALVINDKGIIDSSSAGGEAGVVLWEEIDRVDQIDMNGMAVVRVFLINPEEFIKGKESWLVRWSLSRNFKTYGTPVVIPMFALNSYVDTLESQLKERWEYYKQSTISG